MLVATLEPLRCIQSTLASVARAYDMKRLHLADRLPVFDRNQAICILKIGPPGLPKAYCRLPQPSSGDPFQFNPDHGIIANKSNREGVRRPRVGRDDCRDVVHADQLGRAGPGRARGP